MSPEFRLRSTVASLAAAALFSGVAAAQTPAPAPDTTAPAPQQPCQAWPAADAAKPEPDWTFTGNIGLFSQYVFRGISQTNEKPAVQGGFDLGHKSGFYVGTWASNISWISRRQPPTRPRQHGVGLLRRLQGQLPADFGYDLGVLYYWYPGPTRAATPSPTRPSSTPR